MGGAFRVIGGDDAGLYFRHTDHLGSTTILSDASGLTVEDSEVVYAPFGEVREGELSELTDFGFIGQRLDRSSGDLMYYGARYYLPELRRFISPDTIVPSAANPQALNRYSYTLNSPLNYVDPTGHAVILPTPGGPRVFNTPKPAGGGGGGGGGASAQASSGSGGGGGGGVNIAGGGGYSGPGSSNRGGSGNGGGRNRLITGSISTTGQSNLAFDNQVHGWRLSAEVGTYGVTTNVSNNFIQLATIATALDKIGTRLGNEAGLDRYEAFKQVFGPTHIEIVPGETVAGGYSGINHGFSDGAYQIEIAANPLGRTGRSVGVNLAAHEIGHNLTYGTWGGHKQGYTYNPPPLTVNINGEQRTLEDNLGLGVTAGRHPAECYQCEVTADAIASWGLGSFYYESDDSAGTAASARRNDVNAFMLDVIQDIWSQ